MIKTQRKIQFHNDCGALVNYEELEKAVLWYAPHPVASNKHIYKYGAYPAVSIGKDKIHIHRLLMMFWLNCIIPSSFCVHHIDGNKMNAQKSGESITFSVKKIIEIPTPHGRLIDADELRKDRINLYGTTDVVLMADIENAPTIIEAEVSE